MSVVSEPSPVEPESVGDAASRQIDELWRAYGEELFRYVTKRAPSLDAEDVVAIVFEGTFKALCAGKGPREHPRAYLYAASRNEISRELGRQSSLIADCCPLDERHVGVAGVDELSANSDLLNHILQSWSANDRHLVVGVMLEDRPIRDVAQELGHSVPTASRRPYKLRLRLKQNWLQSHTRIAGAEETCTPFLVNAGLVLAGQASLVQETSFWEHVDSCGPCRERVTEASRSSRTLVVLLPFLIASPALLLGARDGKRAQWGKEWHGKAGMVAGGATATAGLAAIIVALISGAPDSSSSSLEPGRELQPRIEESSEEPGALVEQGEVTGEEPLRGPMRTCSWSDDLLCAAQSQT